MLLTPGRSLELMIRPSFQHRTLWCCCEPKLQLYRPALKPASLLLFGVLSSVLLYSLHFSFHQRTPEFTTILGKIWVNNASSRQCANGLYIRRPSFNNDRILFPIEDFYWSCHLTFLNILLINVAPGLTFAFQKEDDRSQISLGYFDV